MQTCIKTQDVFRHSMFIMWILLRVVYLRGFDNPLVEPIGVIMGCASTRMTRMLSHAVRSQI